MSRQTRAHAAHPEHASSHTICTSSSVQASAASAVARLHHASFPITATLINGIELGIATNDAVTGPIKGAPGLVAQILHCSDSEIGHACNAQWGFKQIDHACMHTASKCSNVQRILEALLQ
eukprot:scaffold47234_cov18-Tisochrysis_lutea.AAC.1